MKNPHLERLCTAVIDYFGRFVRCLSLDDKVRSGFDFEDLLSLFLLLFPLLLLLLVVLRVVPLVLLLFMALLLPVLPRRLLRLVLLFSAILAAACFCLFVVGFSSFLPFFQTSLAVAASRRPNV